MADKYDDLKVDYNNHIPAYEMVDPEVIKAYVEGSDGIITIYSPKQNIHYVYKFKPPSKTWKEAPDWWKKGNVIEIYVLGNRDNDPDKIRQWIYMGYIHVSNKQYRPGNARHNFTFDSPSVKGILRLIDIMYFPFKKRANMKIYHNGRCGICKTLLTNPVSIMRGFGPTCDKNQKARKDLAKQLKEGTIICPNLSELPECNQTEIQE